MFYCPGINLVMFILYSEFIHLAAFCAKFSQRPAHKFFVMVFILFYYYRIWENLLFDQAMGWFVRWTTNLAIPIVILFVTQIKKTCKRSQLRVVSNCLENVSVKMSNVKIPLELPFLQPRKLVCNLLHVTRLFHVLLCRHSLLSQLFHNFWAIFMWFLLFNDRTI